MSKVNIRKHRNSAFLQQDGRCCYCHHPMWLSHPEEYAAQRGITIKEALGFRCTAEHRVARKDGGGDEAANIVAACLFCNRRRHARAKPLSLERYKALVAQRVLAGRWHRARSSKARG